jgi:hypothetical protein
MYTDTPVPQEEPSGQNPPDGAIINYFLGEEAKEIKLEIKDEKGKVIRSYSNKDTLYKIPNVNFPQYWIRPQELLSAEKGSHRFLWDMKYAPLNLPASYPISAIYKNTDPNSTAPWVMPGNYTARLTVDGKEYSQSFKVRMDPRVKTAAISLQQQHDLSVQCYKNRVESMELLKDIREFQETLKSRLSNASGSEKEKLENLNKELGTLVNNSPTNTQPSFGRLNGAFTTLFNQLEETDNPPTSQVISAVKQAQADFEKLKIKWSGLKKL